MDPNTPQQYTPAPKQPSLWESNKTLIKSLLIGTLTLIMLIPASFIRQLVFERESRQQEVIREVSSKWAQAQTIKGPVLLIPYVELVQQADKSVARVRRNAFFMPEQLQITGKLDPEVRHRSIYDVTLYRSQLQLQGNFPAIDPNSLGIAPENMLWNEARLLAGIDDLRGLEENIRLQWDSSRTVLEPGVPANDVISSGLSKRVAIQAGKPVSFLIDLKLKGSEQLFFTPVAQTTKVSISSSWQHPSFEGKFLPSSPATLSGDGFRASWSVLQVSSGIPSAFKDKGDLDQASFGVKLLQPTDGYAKTQRSVKYALLFISLTFTIFFFIEILQKKQIHPLQYLLVGMALCVFYTLLLSFTEYCGFNMAYLVSAAATITLIGLYVWSIFRQGRIAVLFTGALTALYAYIFVLIQLEDYALLFGSVGLFLILAIIMFYSRKIDWYGTLRQTTKA
jgi:inner membrane protein